ncbi:MAG TPA: hypothetical protein PLA68_02200 [Panacibacter sp.]|nr:hypothetical protein [Panacibacter sp.]
MKKTFVKTVSKKFIPALLIATALFAFAPVQSMANNRQDIEILSTENTASVQFAGSATNALLFDVKINNTNGQKFTLVIRNADGDVLFTKEYTDKSFSKKIKILKDETSGTYFSFNILSASKDLENTFEVNATTKVVDDVVITKH